MIKQPTLLRANVTQSKALDIMSMLYGEYISVFYDASTDTLTWYDKDTYEPIAKWTEDFKNIMISLPWVTSIAKRGEEKYRDMYIENGNF